MKRPALASDLVPVSEFRADLARWLQVEGVSATVELVRPGFYPAGGGCIRLWVEPSAVPLRRLDLLERGALVQREALAQVANLDEDIAARAREIPDLFLFSPDFFGLEELPLRAHLGWPILITSW